MSQAINSSAARRVTLNPVVSCAGGECPTIFETDRGTIVLQGYIFNPSDADADVPAGEQMIEVPVQLLADYVRMKN